MSGSARSRSGLIPAAGFGSRHALGDETVLKPLVPVAGRPLIFRALDSLQLAGCDRVVIVLGHEADRVRAGISETYDGDVHIDFVLNPRFDLHNGVSVLSACEALSGEFVLAMSDHVFDDAVMHLVASIECPQNGASLVVDSKLGSILDMDDATKVVVRDERIVAIGKDLSEYNAVDCGIFVAGDALMSALDQVLRATGNATLSDGVRLLAERGTMHAVDLGAGRWQDVDTPEMLIAAEAMLRERAVASRR
jgi:1L-myo-inositol 1-phosphate cytidylyltransferase